MNPFRHFIVTQQPLDIFRERKERMRLVAFAPTIVLVILLAASACYPSLLSTIYNNHVRILSSFVAAICWLLLIANIRRIPAVDHAYGHSSTWFRFVFDLPLLVISLSWSIWCFYICGAFEKAFLLNIYALLVYSASRMVKVPLYSFATTLIGVSFCFLTLTFWDNIFGTAKASVFTFSAIAETFASLYLGLYFIVIQEAFVNLVKKIFRIMSNLFDGVWNDEEKDLTEAEPRE